MTDKEETDEAMRYMLERALIHDLQVNPGMERKMVNRWLEQVRADAWDEGKRESDTAWEHIYFGHPVREGEICPECSTGNPYRKEQTND